MNNRITKQRLKTFFTYESVKLVAVLSIVLVVLTLIFNSVAKVPSQAQTISILIDTNDVIIGENEYDYYVKVRDGSSNRYGLSYDVLGFNNRQVFDTEESPSKSLIRTYHEIYDDDLFIAGKELTQYYLERGYAQEINSYINGLEDFLFTSNEFYSSINAPTDEINEVAVRDYFIRTRGKDSRFLTKSKLENGVLSEIERIKGLKTNLELFKKVLQICPQLIASETEFPFTIGGVEIKGSYVFDLGVLGDGFINVFKTHVKTETENYYTTNGVYLTIGQHEEINGDLYYETLAFILTLVEEYSNILDGHL